MPAVDIYPSVSDFEELVAEIRNNPEKVMDASISPEDLIKLRQRFDPYAKIPGEPPDAEKKKAIICSYTNLREKYLRRFLMTSLVAFLFQALHEWEVPVEKRTWGAGTADAHEMPKPVAKKVIEDFLKYWLAFDPSIHVRKGGRRGKKTDGSLMAKNIPPQDTFHRWDYYTEVNYEKLREITENLYPERPDLDWAIGVWDYVEGSPAEINEKFEAFCQKYGDETPASIMLLELHGWTLLGDFKENREKITFYNKNTNILKDILDRHEEDKRMGAELMRNRIRQAKAKNIAEDGPDPQNFDEYRQTGGSNIQSTGAERVISSQELRHLEKAKGDIKLAKKLKDQEVQAQRIRELCNLKRALGKLSPELEAELETAQSNYDKAVAMTNVPHDAVQVDVFTHDPVNNEFTKTLFYTETK